MAKKKSTKKEKGEKNTGEEIKAKQPRKPSRKKASGKNPRRNTKKDSSAAPKQKGPKLQSPNILFVRSLLLPEHKDDPIIHDFLQEVESYLLHTLFIGDSSEIVVAVSGGVDSVTLLDTMVLLSEKHDYRLAVAHFNHDLRGDSSLRDERFVKKLAEKYRLPFYSSRGRVRQYSEKKSISIEQAARILRYLFLERTAHNVKSGLIATAHMSDDSAETFLINLIRGSGITGLCGIPPKRQMGKNVAIIRPFLQHSKEDLKTYARQRGLRWCEDESNSLLYYTRNKIRLDLIPKLQKDFNPSIIETINRSARLINGAEAFIAEHVKLMLNDMIIDKSSERYAIKIPLLQTVEDFLKGEIIQASLMKHFQIQAVSMATVERIIDLAESPPGAMVEITKNIYVLKDRIKLIFIRRQSSAEVNMKIDREGDYKINNKFFHFKKTAKRLVDYNDDPDEEYFDFDLLPLKLQLRNWQQGDSFVPLGMDGSMKVSDFLINNKVALSDKRDVVVLATKSEIVWICGMRINDRYKVTKQTKRVLKAVIETID